MRSVSSRSSSRIFCRTVTSCSISINLSTDISDRCNKEQRTLNRKVCSCVVVRHLIFSIRRAMSCKLDFRIARRKTKATNFVEYKSMGLTYLKMVHQLPVLMLHSVNFLFVLQRDYKDLLLFLQRAVVFLLNRSLILLLIDRISRKMLMLV